MGYTGTINLLVDELIFMKDANLIFILYQTILQQLFSCKGIIILKNKNYHYFIFNSQSKQNQALQLQ